MSEGIVKEERCHRCGEVIRVYRNPLLTVDIIIEVNTGGSPLLHPSSDTRHPAPGSRHIVLIERKNPPFGWAIPGGFVDYGETLEAAAIREAREETALEIVELRQFHAYSDPRRDPRGHTVSVVFTAIGKGVPKAADDAKNLQIFALDSLPQDLAFDHAAILADYSESLENLL